MRISVQIPSDRPTKDALEKMDRQFSGEGRECLGLGIAAENLRPNEVPGAGGVDASLRLFDAGIRLR